MNEFEIINNYNMSDNISTLIDNDADTDIYIINLKHRQDRIQNILTQFQNIKCVNIKVFNAIKYNPPFLGCSLSHLCLINYAKTNNMPFIIIVEDDIELYVDDKELSSILNKLKNFKNVDMFNGSPSFWDVINNTNFLTKKYYDEDFSVVNWGQWTTFIVYFQRCFDKMLTKYTSKFSIDGFNALYNSQLVYNKKYMCCQITNHSDIDNTTIDYHAYFEKCEKIFKSLPIIFLSIYTTPHQRFP